MPRSLDDLTDSVLDACAEEWIAQCLGGDDAIDTSTLAEDFAILYRHCDYPVPPGGLRIEVADDPLDASARAEGAYASEVGLAHQSWWAARLAVFDDVLLDDGTPAIEPGPDADALAALVRILRAGVWDSTWCVEGVVVVRRPCVVRVDEAGDLHAADGPALAWRPREGAPKGVGVYADHGVVVPARMVVAPESVSPAEWRAASTEVVRVAAARWGWDRYLAHMGASLLDRAEVDGLAYELHDAAPFRLLRKQSPALLDGSQPWYVEPVPAECRSALGARRWQVPGPDGRVLSVDEAERDTSLRYGWER